MMISRMDSTYNHLERNTSQSSLDEDKKLQTQLMTEQRRLKAIDSDLHMDDSQKSKEKLKIQRQIDELNRKMKMEQLEEEQTKETNSTQEDTRTKETKEKTDTAKETKDTEEAKSKETSIEKGKESQRLKETDKEKTALEKQIEETEEDKKEKREELGIPPQQIHKMLSADIELQRERVLNRVWEKKEGQENVLRAEIHSDAIQGVDNDTKKEQLSEMRRKKPIQIEELNAEDRKPTIKAESSVKIVIKDTM